MLIAALSLSGWPASAYRDLDFFQFRAGARALLEGASPYDASWWQAFHDREGSQVLAILRRYSEATWTTPYPLWTFIVLLPFGAPPLAVSAAAWLVVQVGAVGAGVAALIARLRPLRDERTLVLVFALALTFQPAWYLVASGNLTGLTFAALAFAVAAALTRDERAGFALALTIIKPQSFVIFALALLGGLAPQVRRAVLRNALVVVAILGFIALALEPTWPIEWARNAAVLQSSNGSNATGWTLGRLFGGPFVGVASIAAVMFTFALWWAVRRPAYDYVLAGSIPVSVFIAPHGWTHEHLYLLVSALILIARRAEIPGQPRMLWTVAILFVFSVLPWALYSPTNETASALVPLAVLTLVMLMETLEVRAVKRELRTWEAQPAGASA